MTQIIGPNGKPFYLPPSTEAKRTWELARQSARLQNNIAHAEQSIRRSSQPFRPPGSTGQTINPNGTTTTHYGPSGSVTRSPSGRTTYQPGTASPWRSPTQPNPGQRNAVTLRKPATYAPTATMERPPQSVPIRQRGVPRPLQSIPKAGRVAPAARAAGGAAARGAIGAGVASGVLSGAAVAMSGGTLGQSVGAAVGGTAGTVAGAALGAAIGSVVPGPGTAAGAWVGGAIGGWAGSSIGQWAGGLLDPPPDIPSEAITGVPDPTAGEPITPEDYTYSFPLGSDVDLTPYGGVELRIRHSPGSDGVHRFSTNRNVSRIRLEPDPTPSFEGQLSLTTYSCAGSEGNTFSLSAYGLPLPPIEFLQIGVCGASGEIPTQKGNVNRPISITVPPVSLADLPVPVPNKIGTSPRGQGTPSAPKGVPAGGQRPSPTEQSQPPTSDIPLPDPVPSVRPQRYTDPSRTTRETNLSSGTENRSPVTADSQSDIDPTASEAAQAQTDARNRIGNGATLPIQGETEATEQEGWTPFPIPLGMPAGAPRAGDVPKPKGAPKGAVKLRPGGTTATQVKTPEPPKPPPPPKTGNPCGCNVPLLKNQSLINQKLDGLTSGAGLAAEAVSLKAIMDKLNAMQAFAAKAWEMTRIQKVLDVLTFVAVMHNVALLSRDVGETFGWVAGQALNVVGIEDEEGNTIDVYGWFTNGIQSLLVAMFGQELYDDARETWLKASSIVRSASMIIWTMRGIMDATQDLMEWIAEHTGRIGNALKAFGVVGERAYPWMSENAKTRNRVRARISKVTGTLENAEDMASSFAMATGNILEIQDETGELLNQFGDFKNTVIEGIPDPWADNNPVKNDFELSKNNSQSTDINATDSARGS